MLTLFAVWLAHGLFGVNLSHDSGLWIVLMAINSLETLVFCAAAFWWFTKRKWVRGDLPAAPVDAASAPPPETPIPKRSVRK